MFFFIKIARSVRCKTMFFKKSVSKNVFPKMFFKNVLQKMFSGKSFLKTSREAGPASSLLSSILWDPVRGRSAAVNFRSCWSSPATRLVAPPHRESMPLLKCYWNWLLQTRGGDPSPEGARNRSEGIGCCCGEEPTAQRNKR